MPTPTAPNDNPNEPGDDRPIDTRPFLCIPYWNSPRFPGDEPDTGVVRPLPGDVISWECPGITTSPYEPGEPLDVTVDVRNAGHGNAAVVATVVVYWADPTVGFSHPTFLGAATVPVRPRGGFATTPTIRGLIPATAPNHVCLLAMVTHSLDLAKPVPDPINDRHWAQRNLVAAAAKQGGPLILPFFAANPFRTEEMFEVRVRALDRRRLELVALRNKVEPAEGQARVQLLDDRGRPLTDMGNEAVARLALGPQKRRGYSLRLQVDALPAHQVTAVEAELHVMRDPSQLVGSLGFVIEGGETDRPL
jgi:hypothetical protein